ncbi:GagPol3 [Gossypium australe]|uniref:GagPol3 n=1 Tax=Gossypium australe TaxID=47621 RepID=A0A5B6WPX7_9ROSI|nr:GagPol3 [Gossypium australe]
MPPSLRTIKEIQRLTGKVVALNKKVPPIFQSFKETLLIDQRMPNCFRTTEIVPYFPPLLKSPQMRETLYIPKASSNFPVYYVNKVLQHGNLRYTKIEKSIYALIIAVRKLRPYF